MSKCMAVLALLLSLASLSCFGTDSRGVDDLKALAQREAAAKNDRLALDKLKELEKGGDAR